MNDQPLDAMIDTTAGPPVVSGEPHEVAPGVFIVPDDRVPLVPNVGVIVGERAALVVDTGLGPRNGQRVLALARELAGARDLLLTTTHFHPEHAYGTQVFTEATIIVNREQRDEMRQKGQGYLDTFRSLGEEVAHELENVEFVDPQVVYYGACELDLGGLEVQLRSWGPAHSRGDQVVLLPDQRVLFAGDLVENRFFPILPYVPPYDVDVDGDRWITVLEELERSAPQIVIPGHGELGGAELITVYREYLEELREETRKLAADGQDADAIVGTLIPQMLGRRPDWDASEPWRIATAVQSFLAP